MKIDGILETVHARKAVLLAFALALGSCIAENLEDCPPPEEPLRLLVTTDHETVYASAAPVGDRTTRTPIETWYSSIENVDLYVFDENDDFVTQWSGPAYMIGQEYEVPLEELALPQGIYRITAWTNHGDSHAMYNSNIRDLIGGPELLYSEFRMVSNIPSNRIVLEDFMHRHYGTLATVNLSDNALKRTNVITLAPNTHKVNFTVRAFSSLGYSDDDDFQLTITDSNSAHSFDNEFVPDRENYRLVRDMQPQSATRADAPYRTASVVLMQIDDPTETTFEITHKASGERVWPEVDLVALIRSAARANGETVDFKYTREFDIDITLVSDMRLDLKINGWTYRLNRTEL